MWEEEGVALLHGGGGRGEGDKCDYQDVVNDEGMGVGDV
jgi:hypothetical protein